MILCTSTMPLFKRSPTPPPPPVQETLHASTRLLAGAVPASPRLAPPTTQRRPLYAQALPLIGVVIGCSYIPGPRSRADLWTRNAIQRSKAGRTLRIPPTSFLETWPSWGGESWTWTGGFHLPVVLDSVVPAWIFCTSSGCVILISTSTKVVCPFGVEFSSCP